MLFPILCIMWSLIAGGWCGYRPDLMEDDRRNWFGWFFVLGQVPPAVVLFGWIMTMHPDALWVGVMLFAVVIIFSGFFFGMGTGVRIKGYIDRRRNCP